MNLYHRYFVNQITFVHKLIEKSEDWSNRYITILFLDLSKHLLNLNYSQLENIHDSFRYSHGVIPFIDEICEYRKIVWQELVRLSDDISNADKILDIINQYGEGIQESNKDFLDVDLPYISKILDSLWESNSIHTIICAERIRWICNIFHCESTISSDVFKSNQYQLYHLLNGNYLYSPNWLEEKNQKEASIKEYINQHPDSALMNMIDLCCELQLLGKLDFEVNESLQVMFNYAFENKDSFLEAIKYYLEKWRFDDILYPPEILSKLFSFLDDESIRGIINGANEIILNNWEYAYFKELPTALINKDKCSDLLDFFQESTDAFLRCSPHRRIDFLDKFEKYDQEIFFKVCDLILNKKDNSNLVYFSLLFNPHTYKPIDLVAKFKNNLDLICSIYLEMITTNGFDSLGEYLLAIIQVYPPMLDKYLLFYIQNRTSVLSKILEKLFSLIRLNNYIEVFDKIIDTLFDLPFISSDITVILDTHYNQNDVYFTERFVSWMKHYIELYFDDNKKMRLLFQMNAYIELKSRISVIVFFLSKNKNLEAFKGLYLFQRSYSYSGSELPLIQGKIDLLNELKGRLTGISYLQHRAYLDELVEKYEDIKGNVEIDEILESR